MILSVVCIVLQNKVVINLNQFWLMTFFKIQELLIPIACNISSMHTHFMEGNRLFMQTTFQVDLTPLLRAANVIIRAHKKHKLIFYL